jgi:superfamily II DNA or RNA helicase
MEPAYVYVLTNKLYGGEFYKFGSTRNPHSRIKAYKTYYPYPSVFIRLWRVTRVPAMFSDIIHHDEVIKAVMSIPKYNYVVRSYGESGGEEFFQGEPDEIYRILTDNSYELEAVSLTEIDANGDEPIDNSSQRQTILDRLNVVEEQRPFTLTPNEHQLEALTKIVEHFKSNDKGKILWACGLGKTLLSLFSMQAMNMTKVLIGVPSKYLQEQFYQDVVKVLKDAKNILCVGGELPCSTTDKQEIATFLRKTSAQRFVITTYSSCHLMLSVCAELNFTFDAKIGDEAHHLVATVNDDVKKSYGKFHCIPSRKSLFMTATEKIVDGDSNITTLSMDDRNVFGECIDKKTVSWAIENKKITDYSVVVMKNTEEELNNIIQCMHIPVENKELFVSAYMSVKAIRMLPHLTHILVYTNSIANAVLINRYIDAILNHAMLDLNKDDVMNVVLHSKTAGDKQHILERFKQSKYAIMSCVYMFGEGFDLPKLNGVCFAENMESDIRIVQSTLRPNRLEKDNPNKHAYVILPYLDRNDWVDDNKSFEKCRKLINKLRNVDEIIEQKLHVIVPNNQQVGDEMICDTTQKCTMDASISLVVDSQELEKIKLRLRYSKSLNSNLSPEQDEYNYVQSLNKASHISTQAEYVASSNTHKHYIENPVEYFSSHAIWKGWYDFLGVDTTQFLPTKEEWVRFCKEKNISCLQEYILQAKKYIELPERPDEVYYNFSSIDVELGYMQKRRG